MDKRTSFEQSEIHLFEPEAKVGLLATVNPEGLPHITFISSLQAKSPVQLTWGQFCEGRSKVYVRQNPRTGFLILTLDKKLWRGKARWTHAAAAGEDYEMYNDKPMFRYNAYFGISTVHYMDLIETYGRERLPLVRIALASILTKTGKSGAKETPEERILKPWGQGLFNNLKALKFLAHLDQDGFPTIVPLLQCQAPDSRTLVFSPFAYGPELSGLEPGKSVAVFGLTLQMEDILVRGRFAGFSRSKGLNLGRIDLDWVYNSMPPQQGQIYPVPELKPVVDY